MEQWTEQHRALVVQKFKKNNESVIRTQRLFRIHFEIPPHGSVRCHNSTKSPRSANIQELKQRLKNEIGAIPNKMIERVIGYLQNRLEQCLRDGGTHLTGVLFKK
ncbi:hypothetical protein WH47_08406 [Habropoda laboriosa]|uniref:Uncharacterized protein n=1 Tax=Habropoda laboriosa TaxID=597456 RepID=A0A0L7RH06_9HYME|nr:hypothetical protein WH47_08406 [Habropoda laboriosa]